MIVNVLLVFHSRLPNRRRGQQLLSRGGKPGVLRLHQRRDHVPGWALDPQRLGLHQASQLQRQSGREM